MLSSGPDLFLNFTLVVLERSSEGHPCWNGPFGCSLIYISTPGSRSACRGDLQAVENISNGSLR